VYIGDVYGYNKRSNTADIDRPLNVVPAVTPPTVVGTGVKFV
jgi:hypothetical protein